MCLLLACTQVRWREVHGQDGKEQTEAGASKAAAEANGSGGDEGLQQGDGSHGSGDRGQKLRGLRPKEQQQEQRVCSECLHYCLCVCVHVCVCVRVCTRGHICVCMNAYRLCLQVGSWSGRCLEVCIWGECAYECL